MGRRLTVLASFLLVFLGSRAAFALGTLDQTSPSPNTSFDAGTASRIWQQQIQVGLTGPLAGISITATGRMAQFNIRVRNGAAPSTQPVLFQQLVTVSATQPQFVDMTASGITFTAGNLFVMEIQGNGTGALIMGDYVAPPGTPGYPQPLYRNGSAYPAGFTLGFQTFVITCPAGMTCDDGNRCTTNDTCNASYVCVGTPVVCTALDQCHAAGMCDPAWGLCSNPTQPNGTPCNDSNACTQTDVCQAGTCGGSNPVVCTASDQCHAAGVCDPMSGICSNPSKSDGTACTDSNKCDMAPTCLGGVCAGTPTVCAPPDQCHQAGTCDPASGSCSYAAKADGNPCDDGNACTRTDTCMGGICTGGNAVVCSAEDACHDVGMCSPVTGICSNPARIDGRPCPGGECKSGVCTSADGGPISTMTDGGAGAADGGSASDGGRASDGGSASDGGRASDGAVVAEGGGASDGGSAADGGGVSDGGGAAEGGGVSDGGSATEGGGVSYGGGASDGGGIGGGGGTGGGGSTTGGGTMSGDGGSAPVGESGGCGCVIATKAPSGGWVGLGVAIALAARRRRRKGR